MPEYRAFANERSGEISVFIGIDYEGDSCIYIRRGGQYLSDEELRHIAEDLEERLNQPNLNSGPAGYKH